jgi:hypothetical protein
LTSFGNHNSTGSKPTASNRRRRRQRRCLIASDVVDAPRLYMYAYPQAPLDCRRRRGERFFSNDLDCMRRRLTKIGIGTHDDGPSSIG